MILCYMKIDYQLKQFTQRDKEGYIAVLSPKGKVSTNLIVDKVVANLAVSRHTVEAVIGEYMNQVENALKEGYRVDVGNFGCMSLGINSRLIDNPKQMKAGSITLKRIKFTPNKKIMERMREEVSFRRSKVMKIEPFDIRSTIFLDFIKERKVFNKKEYMKAVGCSEATAARDLKNYCKIGLIHSPYFGIYEKLDVHES